MRQSRQEDALQRAVVQWLRLAKPDCLWFAVPNGGARSKVEAAILQGLGVRAGVADLVFQWEGGGLQVELKRPDGKGRQSGSQKEWEKICERHGVPYLVADSLDGVIAALKHYGRC